MMHAIFYSRCNASRSRRLHLTGPLFIALLGLFMFAIMTDAQAQRYSSIVFVDRPALTAIELGNPSVPGTPIIDPVTVDGSFEFEGDNQAAFISAIAAYLDNAGAEPWPNWLEMRVEITGLSLLIGDHDGEHVGNVCGEIEHGHGQTVVIGSDANNPERLIGGITANCSQLPADNDAPEVKGFANFRVTIQVSERGLADVVPINISGWHLVFTMSSELGVSELPE